MNVILNKFYSNIRNIKNIIIWKLCVYTRKKKVKKQNFKKDGFIYEPIRGVYIHPKKKILISEEAIEDYAEDLLEEKINEAEKASEEWSYILNEPHNLRAIKDLEEWLKNRGYD